MGLLKRSNSSKSKVVVPSLADKPTQVGHEDFHGSRTEKPPMHGGDYVASSKKVLPKLKDFSAPTHLDVDSESGAVGQWADYGGAVAQETLANAQKEAVNIRESAKRSADSEIETYRRQKMAEVDSEKSAILKQARDEGLEQGRVEAEAKIQDKVNVLMDAINALAVAKKEVIEGQKQEILDLAIQVAEKVIESEITLNQDVCFTIVSEALNRITDKNRVIIRVSHNDVEFIRLNRDRILGMLPDIKQLDIQDDPLVDQGGCIIETKLGYVDSTIKTKLDTIREAFQKIVEEELASLSEDIPSDDDAALPAPSSESAPAAEPEGDDDTSDEDFSDEVPASQAVADSPDAEDDFDDTEDDDDDDDDDDFDFDFDDDDDDDF